MTDASHHDHMPRSKRRAQVRIGIRARLKMSSLASITISGWARNISSGGLFIETRKRFPVDANCTVSIPVRDNDVVHTIHAQGRIAHHQQDGMGVQFGDMPDGDRDILNQLLTGRIRGTADGTALPHGVLAP